MKYFIIEFYLLGALLPGAAHAGAKSDRFTTIGFQRCEEMLATRRWSIDLAGRSIEVSPEVAATLAEGETDVRRLISKLRRSPRTPVPVAEVDGRRRFVTFVGVNHSWGVDLRADLSVDAAGAVTVVDLPARDQTRDLALLRVSGLVSVERRLDGVDVSRTAAEHIVSRKIFDHEVREALATPGGLPVALDYIPEYSFRVGTSASGRTLQFLVSHDSAGAPATLHEIKELSPGQNRDYRARSRTEALDLARDIPVLTAGGLAGMAVECPADVRRRLIWIYGVDVAWLERVLARAPTSPDDYQVEERHGLMHFVFKVPFEDGSLARVVFNEAGPDRLKIVSAYPRHRH